MRRLIILSFIILIVLISGCGDQPLTNGDVTDGIAIKDFSFDSPEVYSGDFVGLNLEVQNVGEKDGTLTGISVYGGWLSGEVSMSGTLTGTLKPAVPSENIEGESRSFRWTGNAESVLSSTDYQFGVRVKYDYNTEYIGTVRFVRPSYLDTLPKEQKDNLISTNGIVSSSVSNGPLNMNPISGRSFIVDGVTSVTIKFGIKNIGSGYPYKSSEGDYSVEIESTDPSAPSLRCYSSDSANPDTIKLSKGEKSTFICSFEVPSVNNYVDRSFKIIFDYSYYTDESASITVNPTGTETTVPGTTTTALSSTTTAVSSTTTSIPECTVATAHDDCCWWGGGPCQALQWPVCDMGVCKCNIGMPGMPCGSG